MDNAHICLTLSTRIILICEIKKKLCFTHTHTHTHIHTHILYIYFLYMYHIIYTA